MRKYIFAFFIVVACLWGNLGWGQTKSYGLMNGPVLFSIDIEKRVWLPDKGQGGTSIVVGSTLFTINSNNITSFDLKNETLIGSYKLQTNLDYEFYATPKYEEKSGLFISYYFNETSRLYTIIAFDKNGKTIWTLPMPRDYKKFSDGSILAESIAGIRGLITKNGVIYVLYSGQYEGAKLLRISEDNKSFKWSLQLDEYNSTYKIDFWGDNVYVKLNDSKKVVETSDGKVFHPLLGNIVSPNGVVIDEMDVFPTFKYIDITGYFLGSERGYFLSEYKLICYNFKTKKIDWITNTSNILNPVSSIKDFSESNQLIIIGSYIDGITTKPSVMALDAISGKTVWQKEDTYTFFGGGQISIKVFDNRMAVFTEYSHQIKVYDVRNPDKPLKVVENVGGTTDILLDVITVQSITPQPTLNLSATAQNAVATANTASTTLTTNNTWTASSNATWLKVSPTSGNAGTNLAISFTIDANTTTTTRTGVVTFSAGGLTQTFTVTQAGAVAPTLTLSAMAQNAVAIATTASITLTTNNTWTSSSNATWLKISPTSGNAGTNLAISFTIDANTATTTRTGVVTFTAGGLTQTFTVTQANGTPICITTLTYPKNTRKGVTILTHGFSATGEKLGGIIDDWKGYAKAIRHRLSNGQPVQGKGACIYMNNNDSGKWEKLKIDDKDGGNGNNPFDGSGNLNEEIILVYDWQRFSNVPLPAIWTDVKGGFLEAAADNLFRLLADASSDDGLLNDKNLIKNAPVHIIAHSRGTVMALQVLHRIGKYFPDIKIEQLTTLDPHPATSFADVVFDQKGTWSSLPGLTTQIVNGCVGGLGCSNGNGIQLRIPENVKYADNYYRQDGIYENALNWSLTRIINFWGPFLGSFDGVSVNGINSNNELDEGRIAKHSGGLGGSHSGAHKWYFGTVGNITAITNDMDKEWYNITGILKNSKVCRFSSGYYYSRNGGATQAELDNLKPTETVSIADMDKQLVLRPRTDNQSKNNKLGVLNGNFEYKNESGWWGNGGDIKISSSDKDFEINQVKDIDGNKVLWLGAIDGINKYTATHSLLYFPAKASSLTMDIMMKNTLSNAATTENVFQVTFYDKNNVTKVGKITIPINSKWSSYYFEIPNSLKGKSGKFKVELIEASKASIALSNGDAYVDNIEFSDIAPTIRVNLMEKDPTPEQSFSVFPNPNLGQFSIDLQNVVGVPQRLIITDVSGNVLMDKALNSDCCPTINFDAPKEGTYNVTIQTDRGVLSKRLFITK